MDDLLALRWRGRIDGGSTYMPGAVVHDNKSVYLVARPIGAGILPGSAFDQDQQGPCWIRLGSYRRRARADDHIWCPEPAQFPLNGGLSDSVDVCGDCWRDDNFENAFFPERHLYVIQEMMAL